MRKSASDRVIDLDYRVLYAHSHRCHVVSALEHADRFFQRCKGLHKGKTLPVAEGMDTFQLPKCVQD